MSVYPLITGLLLTFCVSLFTGTNSTAGQEVEVPESQLTNGLGPCDLLMNREGTTLFVLAADGRKLLASPVADWSRQTTLELPFKPTAMAFFPDESRLAIVGGLAPGQTAIVRIDQKETDVALSLERVFESGHSPSSVVVLARPVAETLESAELAEQENVSEGQENKENGPENNRTEDIIYIADQFSGSVRLFAANDGHALDVWPAGREPIAIQATPDGRKILSVSLLPEGPSDTFYISSAVRIFDVATGQSRRIEIYNGVSNLRGVTLSNDGRYAFITGTQGNYTTVTSQVVGGWIVENILAIVDLETEQYVDMIFLDDTLLGAGNPWGVTLSDDGRFLVVALSGTDEVLIMPMARVRKIIERRPPGQRPGGGTYAYNYQGDGEIDFPIRVRVKVGTKGIRHLIMRGNEIYALSYFEDVLNRLTLDCQSPIRNWPNSYVRAEKGPEMNLVSMADVMHDIKHDGGQHDNGEHQELFRPLVHELAAARPLDGVTIHREAVQLAPRPVWSPQRRGEVLFHDATYCQEHWLSCVTCHPDARIDGLNWDLVNDGVGNAKNTKSMLLSHETPPAMISGIRADAETAVRAGVTHILFGKLPEEDCAAIDEYLKALRPVPSPTLVGGKRSEAAERGRFLFESSRSGCATCHPEPLFTDLSLHATGTQYYNDSIARFDTPTLVEIWRTAPYLNTGKYVTIRELLFEGKHGNSDDHLDKLTENEQNDLIEYILSL